jgi:hypothetical protein
MVDIPIVTAGAVVNTQRGPVIVIMNQYAGTLKGKTIHSSGQLEWFKQLVDDKSIKVGGLQRITTPEGYVIPINIRSGLPYVTMRPYTDDKWENFPHVMLTLQADWIPSVLDHTLDDDDDWLDAISELPEDPTESLFDEFGNYRHRHVVNQYMIHSQDLDDHIIPTKDFFYEVYERDQTDSTEIEASVQPREVKPKEPAYEQYRPIFCWMPA